MQLTDTHCHLNFRQFDADRDEVLARAVDAGLSRILIPATSVESSREAIELAESNAMLFAAVGVHPTEQGGAASRRVGGAVKEALRELARRPKVVAIGEIGLDYYWDAAPHEVQQAALREQLDLATEVELPVVIHCREKGNAVEGGCASDLLEILEGWAAGPGRKDGPLSGRTGVLHSFSGTRVTAERAIGLGFFIGVNGPVTYQNAAAKRAMIAGLPLDRLLLETDAPFLAPVPQRGQRNEPAFIRHIADTIAEIHATTAEEIAARTTANARRLFCWEEAV